MGLGLCFIKESIVKIDIYTHNFSVSKITDKDREYVMRFAKSFFEYEKIKDPRSGVISTKLSRTYCFTNNTNKRFNFHISKLDEFLSSVRGMKDLKIVEHKYPLSKATKVDFKVKHLFEPRDYQQILIDDCTKTDDTNIAVTLQAGGGKTLVAKHVMNILKVRTFIMMRGGYLDRWIPDLEESFEFKRGDLIVVRGQKDLQTVLELADAGELESKVIMSTIDTVATYMKDYAKFPHVRKRYKAEPKDLFKALGVGLVVFDEGHQNAHKAMRVFCHTHVPKFITLSATLETQETFKNNIYRIMYPDDQRRNGGYRNIYIGVSALMYKFRNMRNIRTKGYMGAYSHVNFENSLMRPNNKMSLSGYLGLVKYSVDLKYMQDYKPGTKCLLFFATVKMCDKAVKYLKEKYPHLKIGRYTAKDKMDVLDDSDIIVSTVLSAGTAVDIINLRTTIMTTAMDSQISNEQSLYRTRPVKDYPDLTPEFCYFVCIDIEKHLTYHRNKKKIFNKRVKYHTEIQLPYPA